MMSLPKNIFSLKVNSDINSLSEVLNWFEKITSSRLSPDLYLQCQLAVSEGFTNAVSHAHKNLPPHTPINLEVAFLSDYLEIKIWDCGQPFDLEKAIMEVKSENSQSLELENGRGLIFMKQLIDEIRYFRNEQGNNCLILRKEVFPLKR